MVAPFKETSSVKQHPVLDTVAFQWQSQIWPFEIQQLFLLLFLPWAFCFMRYLSGSD